MLFEISSFEFHRDFANSSVMFHSRDFPNSTKDCIVGGRISNKLKIKIYRLAFITMCTVTKERLIRKKIVVFESFTVNFEIKMVIEKHLMYH